MPDQVKYYHDAARKHVRKVYPVSVTESFCKGRHSGWACSQSWQLMGADFGYDGKTETWDRPVDVIRSERYMNTGDTRERALNFFGDARRLREGEAEISAEEYVKLYSEYSKIAVENAERK